MKCNICKHTEFADMGVRKSVRCAKCNSLERTRVIGLFIEKDKLVNENSKILHIAPEQGLGEYLINIAGADNITFTDLEPKGYSFLPNVQKLDLTIDLETIPDNSYDVIIHSHVLEHIPCNYTYVLYHLHRILTEKGKMLCSIPFMSGFYDSCASPSLTDDDRVKRFGQNDHIRRFGISDLQLSLGKVYNLNEQYSLKKSFSEEELVAHNIPENVWNGYSPSSVLCLEKNDYLLK